MTRPAASGDAAAYGDAVALAARTFLDAHGDGAGADESLRDLAARHDPSQPMPGADRDTVVRIAVAYSGGADSTALLHALAGAADAKRVALFALHVHHGLQPDADAWLAHCRDGAATLGVGFDAVRVDVPRDRGSLEAEARRVRYAALASLCETHRCTLLVTAHHADDQAEALLVNLARGTGIAGLAATARERRVGSLRIARPLLDLPATTVRAYVAAHALPFVNDPSNDDRRHTRNAIRHEVLAPLRRIAPAVATHLARTAAHAATLQTLLDEIGREDLAADEPADGSRDSAAEAALDVERLATLSPARAANALRTWLALCGLRAPSSAALDEMLKQLLTAAPDAQIALLHERRTLRLYRGRVSVDAAASRAGGFVSLTWRGEPELVVDGWQGRLRFLPADGHGLDAGELAQSPLVVRPRRGGERMRTRVDGPGRTLKNLYQESGIAAWRRLSLPLVYRDATLVYAAGLGLNMAAVVQRSPGVELVTLAWLPDP